MEKNKKLKIAVVGVGGIGSAFAFQLAHVGGHDLTVVARPGSKRHSELTRDQGIKNNKHQHVSVHVTDSLDPKISFDLVIVTLKFHQLGPLLPALKETKSKLILFMFNVFDPESLKNEVGAERCSFGMPFIQSFIDSSGALNATIGAGGQKCLIGNMDAVTLFSLSGLPATLETNMLSWLRSHAALCAAFESVSFHGMQRQSGCTWNEAVIVGKGVRESFRLIEELGESVYPKGKVILLKSPTVVVAGVLWSLSRIKEFRELLASGVEECQAIVDSIVETGMKSNSKLQLSRIKAIKPRSTLKA